MPVNQSNLPGTSGKQANESYKNVLWDPMPTKIYAKLDSIDTELAWELCRADVTSQLLGNDCYGVPFIDEALVFEPFAVLGKINVMGKKYLKYLGQLDKLICPCENMAQFYQKKQRVDDERITGAGRIEQKFRYRISNMKDSIKKGIKICLDGVKVYDAQWAKSGGNRFLGHFHVFDALTL